MVRRNSSEGFELEGEILMCFGDELFDYNEANQTPLWCAAENGHDGVVSYENFWPWTTLTQT